MTTPSTILDQDISTIRVERRKLLPWWVKVFCWIFIVAAVIIPPMLIAAAAFGVTYQTALYGISTNDPLSIEGLVVSTAFVLKGIVGYGLFFEKDWAINVGLVTAAIGIALCLCVMFGYPFTNVEGNFRLEIAFEILFLYKLTQLRKQWY